MTVVGSAAFEAFARFGGIGREARAAGRDIKGLKRDLKSLDTDIQFHADTSSMAGEVTKGVKVAQKAAQAKDTSIQFDADTSQIEPQVRKAVRDAKGRFAKVGVEVEADTAGLRGEVARGVAVAQRGQKIEVPVEVTGVARAKAAITKLKSDTKDLRKGFGGIGGSVDVGGVIGGIGKMLVVPAVLAAVKVLGPALGAAASGAVAFVSALAPATGLLGALPGLAFVAATALGTLFAAFSGIGVAMKAISAEEKAGFTGAASAASAAEASARRREAAARGVLRATEALADAEVDAAARTEAAARAQVRAAEELVDAQEDQRRGREALDRALVEGSQAIVDAQRRERRAQDDLNQARLDAVEALQQMRFETERNSISEERAALRLEDARSRLTDVQGDPEATDRDKAEALLDLRDAELSLREVQDKRADDAAALAVAEAKGIEAADNVVSAREAQEDATRGLADAERELVDLVRDGAREQADAARTVERAHQAVQDAAEESARTQIDNARSIRDANENLVLAYQEATDAANDLGTVGAASAGAVAAAMDNLSPAGQRFVRFLVSLKPALDEIRAVAQEGLFPGVQDGLTKLVGILPTVKRLVGDTATELGNLASRAGDFASSPFMTGVIDRLGQTGVQVLRDTGDATFFFADGLFRMADAARPLVLYLSDLVSRAAEAFDAWIVGAEASGAMTEFFAETARVTETLVGILGSLISIIGSVLEAAAPLGGDLLGGLADGLERVATWADSLKGQTALRDFFEDSRPVLEATIGLLGDILGLFGSILAPDEQSGDLITQIREQWIPVLHEIFDAASVLGAPLVELVRAFLEFFAVLVSGDGGTLLTFVETLTLVLDTITRLMKENPKLRTFIVTLLALAGGLKVFGFIGGLFSTLGPLIGLLSGMSAPALLITAAILGLGAALVYAYTESETFRKVVADVWAWIQEEILPRIGAFADAILRAFSQAKAWVDENMAAIEEAIGHGLAVLEVIWDRFGDNIISIVRTIFSIVAEVVNAGLDIITGIIKFVLAIINGEWGEAWDALLQVVRGVWDLLFGVVRGGVQLLGEILALGLEGLKAIWDGIWAGISAGFGAIWEGITDAIRGGVQGLINVLNFMIGGINSILGVLPGDLKIPRIPDLKAESSGSTPDDNFAKAPVRRNRGGSVPGGGPDRDSVHAILTPGEFVVRRSAVKAFGADRLEQINRMGYNRGGRVGSKKRPAAFALGGVVPDLIDIGGDLLGGAADLGGDIIGGVVTGARKVGGLAMDAAGAIASVAEEVARRGAYAVWQTVRGVAESGLNALPIGNSTIAKMVKNAPLTAMDAIGNFIKGKDEERKKATTGNATGLVPGFLTDFQKYAADVGPLNITSGFRTSAQQALLYSMKPGLAAPPGKSNHERGLAIDHAPHSTPSMRQKALDYNLWYPMAALSKAGPARPGGKYEPWHIEPVSTKNAGGLVEPLNLGGLVGASSSPAAATAATIDPAAVVAARRNEAKERANVNVTIHNPVPEKSDESVRRTVRKLAYTGVL